MKFVVARRMYAELLGRTSDPSIVGFMKLLARKNSPKGHERCPCNSGKRLRDCHRDLLHEARERVSWQDVAQDLRLLVQGNDIK